MIQDMIDNLFSIGSLHIALDLFMWSIMFFVVWRIRRESCVEIREALRDQRSAWLSYRDVRIQNQRLREENKVLRHQVEARF